MTGEGKKRKGRNERGRGRMGEGKKGERKESRKRKDQREICKRVRPVDNSSVTCQVQTAGHIF